jgi:hypothetical protein
VNPAKWVVAFLKWTWAGINVKPYEPGKFDEFINEHPKLGWMIIIVTYTSFLFALGLLIRLAD